MDGDTSTRQAAGTTARVFDGNSLSKSSPQKVFHIFLRYGSVVSGPPAGGSSGMATRPATSPTGGMTTGAAPAAPVAKANPWYPDHALFEATKDQLKGMPEFKYSTQ